MVRPAPLALLSLSMWRTADQAATAVQTAAAEQRHVGAMIEKEDTDDGHGPQHHHYGCFQVDAAYDPIYVTRCWRILLQVDRLLQAYRTPFVGKSSPVLFWWGSFDLSETRFSGRPAPEREWPARWMAIGADQEQAAAGFWPGSGKLPEPAFFAYTYPEPPGCQEATIQPDAAIYHPALSEFILPYDQVRRSPSPDQMILDFFTSTYEVGATLAGWDRAALERPNRLRHRTGERR